MNALATTFYQLLADNVPIQPDKVAVEDGDRAFTYADIGARTDTLAAALIVYGVAPGDRVVVHLRKGIDEVVAMLAVSKVGAVIVNVNAQWTTDQLRYVADDCSACVMIVEQAAARTIARSALPASVTQVIVAGDPPPAHGFAAWPIQHASAPEHPSIETALATIIYTSGSTGSPKGVMLSHRNIVAGARSVARYLGLTGDDRLLGVLPYSFDYGLNQLTTMMLLGGTVVHQPVAMATEIVRTLRDRRITGMAAVPPLWNQVVRLLAASPTPLPRLRRVTNSGGRIPLNVLELMPTVFPGVPVFLMYGLTEAFRSTFLRPDLFQAKMGAIGRAIPNADVFVIRPGQGVAGPGEQGELVHRGPLVSMGYWGRPDITRDKIRPCPELASLIGDEPVVYSGDIVRIDEDGDLWFVGRNDALIKTSGLRVSPDEIEDLVCRSGLIGDAVAFGCDDDMLGQVVHVAVAPLEGFSEAALLTHCRRVMPRYMVPRRVHIWTAPMPRTASGKLARPDIVRDSTAADAGARIAISPGEVRPWH